MVMTTRDLPSAMHWLPALREPEIVLRWDLATWQHVIRLARRLRLLSRLAESIDASSALGTVPEPASRHLRAALNLSRWRTATLCWTIERVSVALGDAVYPRVLLKGASYVGQELGIAKGRLSADLDILVPKEHIGSAQASLSQAGWREAELDEHDRRYYHEWSHEVPPMHHPNLGMELDLHHNILPPVGRTRVDGAALLERLCPSKWPAWKVLDPADQVLHSAAHLFFDSEMRDRIRDLVDLDGLFRHFGATPGFMARLPERARTLGLEEPLALACHFCARWLGTPIPDDVLESIESIGPGRLRRAWLLPLLSTALMPTEPDDCPPLRQDLAATVLLARYHRQRMPLRLLVPHLWHKVRAGHRAGNDEAVRPAGG